jgi:hypothetical protein
VPPAYVAHVEPHGAVMCCPIAAAHPGWHYIGVAARPGGAWCRPNLESGHWMEADPDTCRRLPLAAQAVQRSVVACSSTETGKT